VEPEIIDERSNESLHKNTSINPPIMVQKSGKEPKLSPVTMQDKSEKKVLPSRIDINESESTFTPGQNFASLAEEAPQSSEILSSLLLFVVHVIIELSCLVFFTLPLRVIKWSILFIVAGSALISFWLLFADDNGAGKFGAVFDYHLSSEF